MTFDIEVELLCDENYSLKEETYRVNAALGAGMEVVSNTPHTLTFDLDGEEALKTFRTRIMFLANKGYVSAITVSRSKSGNYHAVIQINPTFPPIPEDLAIAIQACMGSDWKREILGVMRRLDPKPTSVSMLFRPQPLEIVEG